MTGERGGPLPRGKCAECGRRVAIRKNGRPWAHSCRGAEWIADQLTQPYLDFDPAASIEDLWEALADVARDLLPGSDADSVEGDLFRIIDAVEGLP